MKDWLYELSHDVSRMELAQWGDFLAKATLILFGALLLMRLMRLGPAALRHWLLNCLVLSIPLVLVLSFSDYPERWESWRHSFSTVAAYPTQPKRTIDPSETIPAGATELTTTRTVPWLAAYSQKELPWGFREVVGLVFFVWLFGSVAAALFILARLAMLWRCGSSLKPTTEGQLHDTIAIISNKLGLRHTPRLLMAAKGAAPSTWGFRRHTVAVPCDATEWAEDRLQSVLYHELAHARRRDFAWSILQRFALVPLWFHPLAWQIFRELSLARESACDDVAIGHVRARDFADELLAFAAGRRNLSAGVAMSIGSQRRSAVHKRIRALFAAGSHRSRVGFGEKISCLSTVTVLVLVCSLVVACQTPRTSSTELPPGPLQQEFEKLQPALHEQRTTISYSSKGYGKRLRFKVGTVRIKIDDQNREYVNSLPPSLDESDLSFEPVFKGDYWVYRNVPLFTNHRALNADASRHFLSQTTHGVLHPVVVGYVEFINTAATTREGRSVQYHTPVRFRDTNFQVVKNPFPKHAGAEKLGSLMTLSGRVLGDGRIVALDVGIEQRFLAGFRSDAAHATELPLFYQSKYTARCKVESGGLVIFPHKLQSQTSRQSYPIIGSRFSKKLLEQWYEVMAVQVDIIDE